MTETRGGLSTIEEATLDADRIVESTPLDYNELCPLVPREDAEQVLEVDLGSLATLLVDDFMELSNDVRADISEVKFLLDRVELGMNDFDESKSEVEAYMWVVPGILFGVSLATAISMLGVMLAWKDKSGMAVQNGLSYVLLPILVLLCVSCWIVVLCAAFGTMVSSDACTAGTSNGTPYQTIEGVLEAHNVGVNATAFKYITAYTNQCLEDPTKDIHELEELVQNSISRIWREISIVDSVGRDNLIEKCGSEKLPELFSGARNLAKLLTAIRRSLDSAIVSLNCQRINTIYVEFAHDSICTETASSSAYGFILFLLMSISLTVMISLRASWLRNIPEEKVYHDEDEVAENMFLDEHEEYLAYISKYKHEWQEYNGINEDSLAGSGDDGDSSSFNDDEGSVSFYEEDEPCYTESEDTTMSEAPSQEDNERDAQIFPTVLGLEERHDEDADHLDDISFPSLNGDDKEEPTHVPSILNLHPERNPDFVEPMTQECFAATQDGSVPANRSRHSNRSQRSSRSKRVTDEEVVIDAIMENNHRRPNPDDGEIEVQLMERPSSRSHRSQISENAAPVRLGRGGDPSELRPRVPPRSQQDMRVAAPSSTRSTRRRETNTPTFFSAEDHSYHSSSKRSGRQNNLSEF